MYQNSLNRILTTVSVVALSLTIAFAQPGPKPTPTPPTPTPTPVPTPTPQPEPDFVLESFTLQSSVSRLGTVTGKIRIKQKGYDPKVAQGVKVRWIHDINGSKKDSDPNVTVLSAKFNNDGIWEENITFSGYPTSGTVTSQVDINVSTDPSGNVPEKDYSNNTKTTTIKVNPLTYNVRVRYEQFALIWDFEYTSKSEIRVKMAVGTENAAGTVTWVKQNIWFPAESGNKGTYIEADDALLVDGDRKTWNLGQYVDLPNVSEDMRIVVKLEMYEDDKCDWCNDGTSTTYNEYMGSFKDSSDRLIDIFVPSKKISEPLNTYLTKTSDTGHFAVSYTISN